MSIRSNARSLVSAAFATVAGSRGIGSVLAVETLAGPRPINDPTYQDRKAAEKARLAVLTGCARSLVDGARAFSRGSVKLPYKAWDQSATYGERREFLADSVQLGIAICGHETTAEILRIACRIYRAKNGKPSKGFSVDVWTAYGALGQRAPGPGVAMGPAVARSSASYLPGATLRAPIGQDTDTRGLAQPEYKNPMQRAAMAEILAILHRSDLGFLANDTDAESLIRAIHNAGIGACRYLLGRGNRVGIDDRQSGILARFAGIDAAGLAYRRAVEAVSADPGSAHWPIYLGSVSSGTADLVDSVDPSVARQHATVQAMQDRMMRDATPTAYPAPNGPVSRPAWENPSRICRLETKGSGLSPDESFRLMLKFRVIRQSAVPQYAPESHSRISASVDPSMRPGPGCVQIFRSCHSTMLAHVALCMPAAYPAAGQGMQS